MSTLRDFDVPPSTCPHCGHLLNAAVSTDGTAAPKPGRRFNAAVATDGTAAPKPGSLTVCIRCARPLVFMENMQLRLLTKSERIDLLPKERQALEWAINAVMQLHREEQ